MPRPLSFDHLQAILRQHTTALPDVRKPSPNTRYTIQNAVLGQYLCQLRKAERGLRGMNTAQAGDVVENFGQ